MTQTFGPVAQAGGLSTVVDDRFRETDGLGWMLQAEFDATVQRLFECMNEAPASGWETARAAGERMVAGVQDLLSGSCGGDVAVCSGGRALTSLLVTMGLVAEGEAFEYWRSILMPDLARIDVEIGEQSNTFTVESHFGGSNLQGVDTR
ncbi:MAG: histidine phosphatase family protein [Actinobacteria bacterium]|nr:histidine phosphatase family protein [Actinomycetota bacterium]